LVLISKHILGLEPLNTPYKMIAADANRSGSITTYDIVELRKLILGIYPELPNNTSWKFVDKQFVFPDPSNPFKTQWPENKTYASIKGSHMQEDFVAIKVGDLNHSVMANSLSSTEERSEGTWFMDVVAAQPLGMETGEEVEVHLKPTPGAQGYQFTLYHPDLQVLELLPGEGMGTEHFGMLPAEHALTVSWNGTQGGDFRLRLRALRPGLLSDMLQMSSRITRAEAYPLAQVGQAAPKKQDVALRFGDGTLSGVDFELYQNAPNPFMQRTSIGFHLPEAATATLSVYDEMGRLLLTRKGDYAAGYNAISLERGKWAGASGLLVYKLETDTHSATRKMTVVEK
ncbi:MAG TPA: T9SS type A sorting domain-containing protein, partial [Saprospiraceae bacterium]|nr:T9SS type A sorting domain-containing protein [Saprospiraceae bacterium]